MPEDGVAIVFGKERMEAIEAASIVEGEVNEDGDLMLRNYGGDWVNAGHVGGAPGVDAAAPIASVIMTAASSAPSGYLLCDGSAVSRITYAALFAVIGTTYGSGDGSTTFNLPNLKGRVPVGRDSGQTEFDTLGETGGEKVHTLTTTEMPSHTHVQDAHTHVQNSHNHTQNSHTHAPVTEPYFMTTDGNIAVNQTARAFPATGSSANFVYANVGDGTNINERSATAGTTATNNAATATNQDATATNQNTGGGAAHNNLQPYLVMNYIIKY